MTVDTAAPRSRRAILAASLGGVAVFAANALGRAAPVDAANGATVHVGDSLSGTTVTKIFTTGDIAIWGASPDQVGVYGSSSSNDGVVGEAGGDNTSGVHGYGYTQYGVRGTATSGVGVKGESDSQWGVWGHSTDDFGVYGSSTTATGIVGHGPAGVAGISEAGVGVSAQTETGTALIADAGPSATAIGAQIGSNRLNPSDLPPNVAVYGRSIVDATSRGVTGETTNGRGVNGIATNGRGVHGQAVSGRGVSGFATTGVAGYFERQAGSTGLAIRAAGRVVLDNCSGVATIASGTNNITVNPGIDLVPTSAAVATLQGSAGGTTTVHRCTVSTANNTFTIYLTGNSTQSVKVAWHVFG